MLRLIEPSLITSSDAAFANKHFKAALDQDRLLVTHDLTDVWRAILRGEAQFWRGDASAACTEINKYPRCNVLHIWLIGGNLEEVLASVPAFEHFARRYNCVSLTGVGRRGWTRAAPGFSEYATAVVKRIAYGEAEQDSDDND